MTEYSEFWLIISSFTVKKRSISERLCSLLAPLDYVIFAALKFLTALIFLIAINCLKYKHVC